MAVAVITYTKNMMDQRLFYFLRFLSIFYANYIKHKFYVFYPLPFLPLPFFCKIVSDDAAWCRMASDCTGWCKMMQDGAEIYRIVQDGAGIG